MLSQCFIQMCVGELSHTSSIVRYFILVETCLSFTLRIGLSYISFRRHHHIVKFIKPNDLVSPLITLYLTLVVVIRNQLSPLKLVVIIKSQLSLSRAYKSFMDLPRSITCKIRFHILPLFDEVITSLKKVVKEITHVCLE